MHLNKPLLAIIIVLVFSNMSAEETEWIIAAEKFTTSGVPEMYENFSNIIPRLILSRIGGISNRFVLGSEKKERELQVMVQSRIGLIRERSALLLTRDKILLYPDSDFIKKGKKNDATKSILAKEKEIHKQEEKISAFLASGLTGNSAQTPLKLWKSGNDLYTRIPDVSLLTSLTKDNISGLVTGSIEDIAGYIYVTVKLETGIDTVLFSSVSDASSYDNLETLVSSLTALLVPQIANRKKVQLHLSVEPQSARIFIDGILIGNPLDPVTVFSGEHDITVSASGYFSVTRKAQFDSADAFSVKINLDKEPVVSVAFDTKKISSSLYMHTKYFGETPLEVDVPSLPTIGETVASDVHTYFLFKPVQAENGDGIRMTIRPNAVSTETRIEKQRKLLYWSLGALYLSLPLSMLSYGIQINTYQAYKDGKLPETQKTVNSVNSWANTAIVTRGISIGLGLNTVFQLIRFFIAADQATPQDAEIIAQ